MSRRFFVPAGGLAVFLSLWLVHQPLSGQDAPAPETPAQPVPAAAPETPAQAQPAPPAPDPGAAPPTVADPQQVRAAYEAKLAEWKEVIKALRTMNTDYQLADEAGRANMETQWVATKAQANNLLAELTEVATRAFVAAPNEDRALARFLVSVLKDDVERDRYEPAAALGNALIDGQCDLPQIFREAGMANFAINNLDRAEEIFQKAEATSSLSGDARMLRKAVRDYVEFWAPEKELRDKEAAADDLPRVKLTTSKGDIVVELFENEAPETVGNFVSLVKKGFYNGLSFHRVLGGFMAQAGCPEGDGTGGPGYAIYDEFDKPGARKHFRGSLSMANRPNSPNSGGSQFFICFRPDPQLNGKYTAFGRVIEGLDVLEKIQRRNPEEKNPPEPDKILTAEVLRDRGHEYLPRKVE